LGPIGHLTEVENADDLEKELKILSMGQYFLDTFKKRALSWGYNSLPKMDFNSSGAFVGTLTKAVDPPVAGKMDNRSLIYSTFLAAPLLPFGKPGYTEDKWSGTNQPGSNETPIGRILGAFAHHSVVDSNKTCVLVDLQGLVSPEGSITLIDPQAHT
jgi:myosin-heavy-chain kinase